MRAVLFSATLMLAAACLVDLPDEPGLACDDLHPCSIGRDCIAGICHDEGGAQGGGTSNGGGSAGGDPTGGGSASTGGGTSAGGGSAGSSGGGTAGGMPMGRIVWQQKVDGFSGQTVEPMAMLEVKTDAGNQVTATIRTSNDANDTATANQNQAMFMPQTGHGHLKGRFRLPSTLSLSNNSTFFTLTSAGNVVLSLTFDTNEALVCRSDPGFVLAQGATQTVTWPGGFTANTDFTLDVTWKRGEYRRLSVNGTQLLDLQQPADAGPLEAPDTLRLGITGYSGTSDAGWSIILNDWRLADDPSVPL